jgi:hypothetical protein
MPLINGVLAEAESSMQQINGILPITEESVRQINEVLTRTESCILRIKNAQKSAAQLQEMKNYLLKRKAIVLELCAVNSRIQDHKNREKINLFKLYLEAQLRLPPNEKSTGWYLDKHLFVARYRRNKEFQNDSPGLCVCAASFENDCVQVGCWIWQSGCVAKKMFSFVITDKNTTLQTLVASTGLDITIFDDDTALSTQLGLVHMAQAISVHNNYFYNFHVTLREVLKIYLLPDLIAVVQEYFGAHPKTKLLDVDLVAPLLPLNGQSGAVYDRVKQYLWKYYTYTGSWSRPVQIPCGTWM